MSHDANERGISISEQSNSPREKGNVSVGAVKRSAGGFSISGTLKHANSVYLLIDCSSSMAEGKKMEQAKNGGLEFARDALEKGYGVGLISFSVITWLLCEPQKNISELEKSIRGIVAVGSTNMEAALALAFEKLKGLKGKKVAVLVTDGDPTEGEPDPKEAALRVALKMRDYGIDIITIGTDDADEGFLKRIASRTDLNIMVKNQELQSGIGEAAGLLPSPTQ